LRACPPGTTCTDACHSDAGIVLDSGR
jgi:hypothetical protein